MGLFDFLFGKKKAAQLQKAGALATEPPADTNEREVFIAESTVKVAKTYPKATTSGEKNTPKPAQKTAPEAEPKSEAKTEKKAPAKKTSVPKAKFEVKAEKNEPAKAKSEMAEAVAAPEASEDLENASEETTKNFTGTFEINRARDGKQYFFNLFASNKVGIASSQMYASAQSALTGVNSVIANAAKAPIEDQSLKTYETLPYPKWEIYLDNGGKYRFRLNAVNGSCICHSQGYTTKSACKNGIDSIIKSSRNPKIIKNYIKKKED